MKTTGHVPGVCLATGLSLCTAFATSCRSIVEPPRSFAPVNACPDHPCSAFAQTAAVTCTDGACTAVAPSTGILLVVSLAQDSSYAPGLQFVVPLDRLEGGHLPGFGADSGGYLMSTFDQSGRGVGFFLGNQDAFGAVQPALLPSQVTYQLLADPFQDDVVALGLPIRPVQAVQSSNTQTPFLGPYGSPGLTFQANLPPGTYERTIAPEPSFDSVFPPQVRSDLVVKTGKAGAFVFVGPGQEIGIDLFDITNDISSDNPLVPSGSILPTFDIRRNDGLDGWTAFLRDTTTKSIVSNVRELSGTMSPGVQLVTNHATIDPLTHKATDALANTELVLAPPPGEVHPHPAAIVATTPVVPMAITYPLLPEGVNVTGTVTGPGGAPIAADLVFEAVSFLGGSANGPQLPLEYIGRASARPPAAGGPSVYSLELPVASYRVDVRPLDPATAMTVEQARVDASATLSFKLPKSARVRGTAALSDGRPLGDAVVEVLPLGCASPAIPSDAGPTALPSATSTTTWCMPRPAQTIAAADGSFSLPVDAGHYLLRVRPTDGTRLPWTVMGLDTTGKDQTIDVVVPAPFHVSLNLLDPGIVAVRHATVQAFAVPSVQGSDTSSRLKGRAVEIGQTLTDAAGTCDLYMTLPP